MSWPRYLLMVFGILAALCGACSGLEWMLTEDEEQPGFDLAEDGALLLGWDNGRSHFFDGDLTGCDCDCPECCTEAEWSITHCPPGTRRPACFDCRRPEVRRDETGP